MATPPPPWEGAPPEDDSAGAPLIVCSRAARRLELLFRQGVDLTPRIREACPSHLWGRKDGGQQPAAGEVGRLAAALLRGVVEVPEAEASRGDGSGQAWQLSRDPQLELAVTTDTLRLLKLSSGTLVYVSNPAEPCVAPHVARVLALPPSAREAPTPRDVVAYLAPNLAHNLGLALHLRPLLPSEGAAAGGQVALHRLDGLRPGDGGTSCGGRTASLPQPGLEEAQVAVAEEVDIAVVRTPAVTALGPASARPSGGSAAERDGGGAAAVMAAPPADETGADLAADALRRYLVSATRVVCEGDVFAAPRAGQDEGASQLLANLNRLPAGANGQPAQQQQQQQQQQGSSLPVTSPDLVHFKVMRLAARGSLVAAVDVDATTVRLVGSCSTGLPVGLPSYVTTAAGGAAAPGLPSLLPTWRQLAELLASMLHPSTARLPLRLAILLHGPPGSGKRSAAAAAAAAVGCHLVALSCHDFRPPNSSDKQVLEGLRTAFDAAAAYRPLVLSLQQFETLAEGSQDSVSFTAKAANLLSECILEGCRGDLGLPPGQGGGALAGRRSPLVLVACADAVDDIPASLRRCFTHEIHLEAPTEDQRRQLLESKLGGAAASGKPGVLDDAAKHTAGLLPRELSAVAADACALAATDRELVPAIMSGAAAGGAPPAQREAPTLTSQHLNLALESVRRQRMATDIGAPAIPNVTWQDVGGLEDVKRAILDTVELPLKHPILFARGLRRRSGVLLYGPPGTGKTLLAKAVATECKINFLSVKGPELINMYVGESERQIREVFARARQARPCVVFFDELDSLAPARGKGSDSGGVMDRVVSQLLAEIDGMQAGDGGGDVFIIGATNRPDLLDAAMLRPGRLDKLLYVGIAEGAGPKRQVLHALTRKFRLRGDVDLGAIAAACPARFTGADMYALSADAWMVAFRRGVAEREAADGPAAEEGGGTGGGGGGGGEEDEEEEVEVGQADFTAALGSLQPSLSEEEIRRYRRIREQYESR